MRCGMRFGRMGGVGMRLIDADALKADIERQCNELKKHEDDAAGMDYCPNCGAKMI